MTLGSSCRIIDYDSLTLGFYLPKVAIRFGTIVVHIFQHFNILHTQRHQSQWLQLCNISLVGLIPCWYLFDLILLILKLVFILIVVADCIVGIIVF